MWEEDEEEWDEEEEEEEEWDEEEEEEVPLIVEGEGEEDIREAPIPYLMSIRFTPPYNPWNMGGRPRVNHSRPTKHYTPHLTDWVPSCSSKASYKWSYQHTSHHPCQTSSPPLTPSTPGSSSECLGHLFLLPHITPMELGHQVQPIWSPCGPGLSPGPPGSPPAPTVLPPGPTLIL